MPTTPTTTPAGSTTAQKLVTVTIAAPGLGELGTFEVRSGGNAGSETSSFTPGGTNTPRNIGGRQTYEDITLNRVFLPARDRPLMGALYRARAWARVSASDQPLGADYLPWGDPVIWQGVLAEVMFPESDSDANDPARVVLVVNVDGIKA